MTPTARPITLIATTLEHAVRRRAGRRVLSLLALLALLALSACSITIGAPPATPGPNEPTNTPIEQIHFDITPVATPTPVPPTPTPVPVPPGTTPPPRATTGPGGTIKYTVKPGDTLSGIAQQYGITVDDIVKANNIADPNQVQAGQVLLVPTKGATPAGGPNPTPTKGP